MMCKKFEIASYPTPADRERAEFSSSFLNSALTSSALVQRQHSDVFTKSIDLFVGFLPFLVKIICLYLSVVI